MVAGSEIRIAQLGTLSSINSDVAAIGNEHNAGELANLTTASFFELDSAGELVPNEMLGTVTVVTRSPLVVKYELNDGAKWSDGVPIDAADLALSLAAGSSLGGVYFQSVRVGTGVSEGNIHGKLSSGNSITVEYSRPISDYQTAITLSVPAHVVARLADSSLETVEAAKKYVLEAVNANHRENLKLLAEAYRNGFNLDNLSTSAVGFDELTVSSGPYRVENISAAGEVTLIANQSFKLGEPTHVERARLIYFADATAAVAAMVAGEVDVSSAEDSGLVSLGELKSLAESATDVKISSAISGGAIAEQILLNFASDSVFADGSTAESSVRALNLRKAFLYLIPKQRILIQTSARYTTNTSNSFVFDAASDYYQTTEHDNGSADYLIQDVEKSAEILGASEIDVPVDVRVVFDTDNPRAQAEWLLIQERATEAGFNLVNISSPDPSRTIAKGEFDVFIGPRELMSSPAADVYQLSGNSITAFRSEKVDALLAKYALATGLGQKKLLKEIDIELFKSAFGLPLYEVPAMLLFTDRVAGFVPSPHCFSATWGYQNWSVPASSAATK